MNNNEYVNATQKKTDGFCIAGLVLGICSLLTCGITWPLGIVFSIIGLVRVSRNTCKGKGLGVAGIITSLSAIIVFVLIIVYGFNHRTETSTPVSNIIIETIQDTESVDNTIEETQSLPFELVDGMTELQSFYLWIDQSASEEEIVNLAETLGFNTRVDTSAIVLHRIFISESNLNMGPGAEVWYYSDTDWISIYTNQDGEITSARYNFINENMSIEYNFHNEEVELEQHIPGITGTGSIIIPEEQFSIREDAIRYVTEQ